jgi:hypothetical protein
MLYVLWDSASGNAIAGFPAVTEALAVVRAEMEAGGEEAVAEWLLAKEDSHGRSKLVAEGTDLVERARAAARSSAAIV